MEFRPIVLGTSEEQLNVFEENPLSILKMENGLVNVKDLSRL